MPFDLDCNDVDFRTQLSEDQLERLERRQALAQPAARPPTSLAAAVDRLSSGAGDEATAPAEAWLELELNDAKRLPPGVVRRASAAATSSRPNGSQP